MKILLPLMITIGLCAAPYAQDIPVLNGDFEDADVGATATKQENGLPDAKWVTGWDLYQGTTQDPVTITAEIVSGGSVGRQAAQYSVETSGTNADANAVGIRRTPLIPVPGGEKLTISLDVRKVTGAADFSIVIYERNSSGQDVGAPTTFRTGWSSITPEYQTLTTDLTPNAATTKLAIQLRLIPMGDFRAATVEVDNFKVSANP
jgi:hypothetical protein